MRYFHAKSLVDYKVEVNKIVADKGYDSTLFKKYVELKGGKSIVAKQNYGRDIDKSGIDLSLYKYRHLVENSFGKFDPIIQF
ncbi:hypothetical protein [Candidatus Enterovibrio escicola]|uniref:Mobile element protein n=1 Tax=Candidatus Enterovibrio escicola TaxID=1927127 RepID=A0A2A5T607_9GAMM|nr:hypothetical protein [Candidatus Enterovibrio escacola]PCS23573.1 Mobile element protein [Candidatus Enterovibrio escacola]